MNRKGPKDGHRNKNRGFSIELGSRRSLRNVNLADDSTEKVLLEGTLGELVRARFAEDVILEIIGKEGILRIDLAQDEIKMPTEGNGSEVSGQ
jgi:hypothetical protein